MIDPLTEDEHKALLANSEELQLRRAEDEKRDDMMVDLDNAIGIIEEADMLWPLEAARAFNEIDRIAKELRG